MFEAYHKWHRYLAVSILFCLIIGMENGKPKCEVNSDYKIRTPMSARVFMCKSQTNKFNCSFDFLELSIKYVGCTRGKPDPKGATFLGFRMVIFKTVNMTVTKLFCVVASKWITDMTKCVMMTESVLPLKPVNTIQFTGVICGTADQVFEMPVYGYPKFQITYMENVQGDNKLTPILWTGTQLSCISNCKGNTSKIMVESGDMFEALVPQGPKVTVYNNLLNADTNPPMQKVFCSNGKIRSPDYFFRVASNYKCVMYNGISEYTSNDISYGDQLSCNCNGTVTINKVTTTSQAAPSSLGIVVHRILPVNSLLGARLTLAGFLKASDTMIEMPLGDFYVISCHVGDFDDVISPELIMKSYRINFKKVVPKTRLKTEIMYKNSSIQGKDIINASLVFCNQTYYTKVMGGIKGVWAFPNYLYLADKDVDNIGSNMFIHDKAKLPNNTKKISIQFINVRTFPKYINISSYFFCFVKVPKMYMMITRPMKVFSGDRPHVEIFNIYPKFSHRFSLKSFTYGCRGKFTSLLTFTCTNCSSETGYFEAKKNAAGVMILEFSNSISDHMQLNYLCEGTSLKYEAAQESRIFYVIHNAVVKMDDDQFYSIGDSISCTAFIHIIVNDTYVTKKMNMPVWINTSNVVTKPVRDNTAVVIPKGVRFESCCVRYVKQKFDCSGNWNELKVTKSHTLKWNKALTGLYPFTKLQCSICLKLTYHTSETPCVGEFKKYAYVSLHVTKPDGTKEGFPCSTKKKLLIMPQPPLMADNKTRTKISQLNVQIGCCVRKDETLYEVTMKSCNFDPPKIYIIPKDKALFTVNESISCTTSFLPCQQGLRYKIKITVPTVYSKVHEAASFTFTTAHIGEIVYIRCITGITTNQFDERIISVFSPPFNLVIRGLKRYLFEGDYLSCNVDGFPKPDVYWIQIRGRSKLRVSEHFLLMRSYDYEDLYEVSCEAKNKLGAVSKTSKFFLYNIHMQMEFSDTSKLFYILIPAMTSAFVILILLAMLLIFQENFFQVPFFSNHKANKLLVDSSKRSNRGLPETKESEK